MKCTLGENLELNFLSSQFFLRHLAHFFSISPPTFQEKKKKTHFKTHPSWLKLYTYNKQASIDLNFILDLLIIWYTQSNYYSYEKYANWIMVCRWCACVSIPRPTRRYTEYFFPIYHVVYNSHNNNNNIARNSFDDDV